jgi:hypothetical protein
MTMFAIHNENNEQINNFDMCINIQSNDEPELPLEKYGYDSKLNIYRNNIDNIKNDNWKKVRWYINEYDFLVKDPIINRAFYKYWEIINEFEIFDNYVETDLILHCAEAPGGFIQGTNIYLQIDRIPEVKPDKNNQIVDEDGWITPIKKRKNKTNFKIYTISLNKDLPQYKSYNLPSYNKHILNKYICITYGKDNTGDINNWENIQYIGGLSKKPFYLITADGGFDEGTDFNNKEQLHYGLILSEIYSAIYLQQQNGHFILKVFDIFTETSINLLYLLTICYKQVYIYKPKTSRPTNSEKYIICKNFRLNDIQKNHIISSLDNCYHKIKKSNKKYISLSLFKSIPQFFVDKIYNINKILLDIQCDFLKRAIILCDDDNFITTYDEQLDNCIEKRRSTFQEWETIYNLNSFV